jgi:hypothetical protein
MSGLEPEQDEPREETSPPAKVTLPAFAPAAHGHQLTPSPPARARSFFWPLLLIALGTVFLLSNLGLLPGNIWNLLWRFWPVLLIIAGVDVLLGRRSTLGSILVIALTLLLVGGAVGLSFFAREIPGIVEIVDNVELRQAFIAHPRAGLERAEVGINWPSAPGQLSVLRDSNNVIEGDLNYYGDLTFEVSTRGNQARIDLGSQVSGMFISPATFDAGNDRWDVYLSPDVRFDLDFNMGSGRTVLDLAELQVEELRIDAGSGFVRLTMPRQGTIRASIDGGSGAIQIVLPEGMEARVELDEGSGSFRQGSRFEPTAEGGFWETPGFRGADNFAELKIDQGSGSITIE